MNNKHTHLSNAEREELDFYRSFMKSMNGAMYVLNLEPYYLEWISNNDCVERVTGLNAEEVIKKGKEIPTWLLDSPDFQESVIISTQHFLKNPDVKWAGVYRIRHTNGSFKWMMYSAVTSQKSEEGIPQKCAVIAFPLEDVFNTPKTLKEFQQYLAQEINKNIIIELTERQIEVLKLLAQGLVRKEIAAELNISPYTVQDHKKALLTKLNCKNTCELVKSAQKIGLI